MKGLSSFAGPVGLSMALILGVASTTQAQTDTTRQVRSDVRIGVQKDRTTGSRATRDSVTVVSAGEVVMNANTAKIAVLTSDAERERLRLDALAAEVAAKNAELNRSIIAVQDSLILVRGQVTTMNTRTLALGDSVRYLNGRISRFKNGSLFNNSGFYIGLGSGANFTNGTMEQSGYHEGLNVVVPIGWQKRGNAIGIRTELGVQTFDGQAIAGFANPDARVYSAVGMLSLHMPLNSARTSTFFLMGGGGAYSFREINASSSLASRLGQTASSTSTNQTKLGVTGGAGIELHILGATSFFLESRLTNVMGDESSTGIAGTSKNLRWVPVTLGFTLR